MMATCPGTARGARPYPQPPLQQPCIALVPRAPTARLHRASSATHGTWPDRVAAAAAAAAAPGPTTGVTPLQEHPGSHPEGRTDRGPRQPSQGPSNGNGTGTTFGNHAQPGLDSHAFVHLFRQASPYIEGHRGKTFVVVIPGAVTADQHLLQLVLSDIALLHGLGVSVVVVTGVQQLIDTTLEQRNIAPRYLKGYRITDAQTMKITIEVAGEVRTQCEQALSKGPAVPMIRRHTKAQDSEIHFEPALHVVSGNYVTAKRRGIIDGVDYGMTGEVRFVLKDAIKQQLSCGNIVLLSHLGFTAGGEVLNCSASDVALHAAVELAADKLLFLHMGEVESLKLPAWLPLSDAQDMLLKRLEGLVTGQQLDMLMASMDIHDSTSTPTPPSASPPSTAAAERTRSLPPSMLKLPERDVMLSLDIWSRSGFPAAVSTCVMACCRGVKRAHLLDARMDGGLLLELYSRDGVGTMISSNFFEGIRKANTTDVDAVLHLLEPLEKEGILVKRTKHELEAIITDFVVIEREGKLMGCAMLLPLGPTDDGVNVAEIGAFTVDRAFRGSGRGDSMLDYLEQDARQKGIRRLVLLTTRTADWFEQRDFRLNGPAAESGLIPEARRARINPARNSQLYVKELEAGDVALSQPGKRIGF